jgi:hypothetical protein
LYGRGSKPIEIPGVKVAPSGKGSCALTAKENEEQGEVLRRSSTGIAIGVHKGSRASTFTFQDYTGEFSVFIPEK